MKIDLEKFICSLLEEYNFYPEPSEEFKSLINALKQQGLSYKNGKIVEIEPKQEWSEEDEKYVDDLIAYFTADMSLKHTEGDIVNWLNSLKDRYTWKPSDEQMDALEHFVRSIGESGYACPYDNNTKLLYLLLSDLKKIKA